MKLTPDSYTEELMKPQQRITSSNLFHSGIVTLLLSTFLFGCSAIPVLQSPQTIAPQPATLNSSFMAPVTNATDGRGGAKSASLTLAIAPQLLKSQDEKIVRDGLKSLLQKKGYSECDRDSFCLSEVGVLFSIDPDPTLPYTPYSPSKMICRLSIVDATSRQELYKLHTGLIWQNNADTTFQALFDRLHSEVPHS